ncbi:hypothetical protein P3T76_006886 [Phytophthora citrophthora]|uniref:Uncharacterized protein n=1 Tax=Phytophthora citrophthora TaxID=4793 RepID=A0AAD9GNG6_9STRA|nr:hypothetical protein P3T76_006886 [Phytophthora citrophthora]
MSVLTAYRTRDGESCTSENTPGVTTDKTDEVMNETAIVPSTTDAEGGGEANTVEITSDLATGEPASDLAEEVVVSAATLTSCDEPEATVDPTGITGETQSVVVPRETMSESSTTDADGGGEASTKRNAVGATTELTRVFSEEELDRLTEGVNNGVLEEKEEYDKELEERLFPLDEIELKKRVEANASQSQMLSLTDLSAVLGIPEEVINRTRESSPGELSTPEYWTAWYRKTLAATDAAKRANRDFSDLRKSDGSNYFHKSVTDSDERDEGGGITGSASSRDQVGVSDELPTYSSIEETVIANVAVNLSETSGSAVNAMTVSSRRRKRLDPKWWALVQRMVYYLVKEGERSNPVCVDCGSPLLSDLVLREVDPGENDLEERALAKVAQYYRAMSSSVMKRIVNMIVEKYLSEGPLIRAKLKEREDRCEDCLKAALPSRKTRSAKQVRFDCSSLSGQKVEELGPRSSRENSDSVYEYAYVVTDPCESPLRDELVTLGRLD